MTDQIIAITSFIANAFLQIWPYLLITIPLAVAIQMSGASKYINRAFQARPMTAIFLATIVGAFSPFCSCSVIPIIATLLISGVPLAPVMAFWIASPSMDPEMFFLSVATIGWKLAIWRMAATLILSLSAGYTTHIIVQQGWLGHSFLRKQEVTSVQSTWVIIKQGWTKLKYHLTPTPSLNFSTGNVSLAPEAASRTTSKISLVDTLQPAAVAVSATGPAPRITQHTPVTTAAAASCGIDGQSSEGTSCGIQPVSFRQRLLSESWSATTMVIKFMTLAFFLEALITLYIPSEWIAGLLGHQNPFAILTAALIGIPVYTSNLAALPMVSGLLTQGMNPAAALAFLIAGPTTTLPAMAAVWGLTTRRVFALYVSFSLIGAIVMGYIYSVVSGFGL